jgi:hypothetical protein
VARGRLGDGELRGDGGDLQIKGLRNARAPGALTRHRHAITDGCRPAERGGVRKDFTTTKRSR